MSKPKTLSKIKTGVLSRGFSLAKMSINVGAKAAGHAIGSVFSSENEQPERLKALLMSQLGVLSRELGQLKGSVMKVGQMLSVYGEHFLPPEANALLKTLQSQSPPLAWSEIEKVLKRELGDARLAELEIDIEPLASASLGQVYRARRKSDGLEIALKVQYPGVDQAIEGDIKTLRYILSATKLIPKGPKYDAIFEEIREMLLLEMDYARELIATFEFQKLLKSYPRYIVPTPIPAYSSSKVLATTLEQGLHIDSPEIKGLSQERRNEIGIAALELYFLEIFRFGKMQTDPHFGNYRIRLGENGKSDQILLFDFGAVKQFSPEFLKNYYLLPKGAFYGRADWILRGASGIGFLREGDSPELRDAFCKLCTLFLEPFLVPLGSDYDWSANDLPKRAASEGSKLALGSKLRAPPQDVVFLDRKMAGVFIFLSVLKVKANTRALVEKYLGALEPTESL